MSIQIAKVDDWIGPTAAARLLGLSPATLKRNHAKMGIRMRAYPGVTGVRFNLEDILKFKDDLDKKESMEIEAARRAAAPPAAPGS